MTREQEQYIRAHWKDGDTAVGNALGINRFKVYRYRVKHDLVAHDGADPVAYEKTLDVPYITTPEDLLKVMQVNEDLWEIAKLRVNAWGTDGQSHQVRAELIPRGRSIAPDRLEEIISKLAPTYEQFEAPEVRTDGHALEINLTDLHLGKIGVRPGEPAEEVIRRAVRDLVEKARGFGIARFMLPIGSDFLNIDNLASTTTGGTPQLSGVEFSALFEFGFSLYVEILEKLAAEAPVDAIVLPGNHDRQSAFCMGIALRAYFRNHPGVTIDAGADPRKFWVFGKNLVILAHGDGEKPDDMPLLAATERPDLWAGALHREVHLGHLHTRKRVRFADVQEFKGTIVRHLSSLTVLDRWHQGKGYVGNQRAAEAFVWHPTDGLAAQIFHSVPHGRV